LTVLSAIRKQNLFYPLITGKYQFLCHQLSAVFFCTGSHLLSHTVTSIVSSAAFVLTIVFGMWTGVSQKRIATRSVLFDLPLANQQ
jgi:hypothetical protein